MVSLFDMFKVETGPPSSHIVGPMKAGKQFVDDLIEKGLLDSVTRVTVDVYGLLSLTGKGYHTDTAIIMGLTDNEPVTMDIDSIPGFIRDVEGHEHLLLAQGRREMDFPRDNGMRFRNGNLSLHENGIQIHIYNSDEVAYSKTYYSIGGGFIVDEEYSGQDAANGASASYPFKFTTEFLAHCNEIGYSLSGLAMQNELALHSKREIGERFAHIWQTMQVCTDRGMNTEGVLPDLLCVLRRASAPHRMPVPSDKLSSDPMNVIDWVSMFALAVNKENTAGGRVVTAPTNGACGIIPAMLVYYGHFIESVSPDIHTRHFMAAGAIGALHKMSASISGAEAGCQGEVGVACSIAAAGLAKLLGDSPGQACVAVEIGMEHNFGLTCDPVAGQVQMLCIERNAIVSVKAINTARMALHRTSTSRVSLDKVIGTMYETGRDTSTKCRETSRSGLAIKIQCD